MMSFFDVLLKNVSGYLPLRNVCSLLDIKISLWLLSFMIERHEYCNCKEMSKHLMIYKTIGLVLSKQNIYVTADASLEYAAQFPLSRIVDAMGAQVVKY